MAELASDAGLRRDHRPASTAVKKSRTARLNASGSSRLIVCPAFGSTTRPADGIVRYKKVMDNALDLLKPEEVLQALKESGA